MDDDTIQLTKAEVHAIVLTLYAMSVHLQGRGCNLQGHMERLQPLLGKLADTPAPPKVPRRLDATVLQTHRALLATFDRHTDKALQVANATPSSTTVTNYLVCYRRSFALANDLAVSSGDPRFRRVWSDPTSRLSEAGKMAAPQVLPHVTCEWRDKLGLA